MTRGWEAGKEQWGHGPRTGQSCKRLQTPTSSHPRTAHVRKEAAAPLFPAFPTPRVRVFPDTDQLSSSLNAPSRSCNGTPLRHSLRVLVRSRCGTLRRPHSTHQVPGPRGPRAGAQAGREVRGVLRRGATSADGRDSQGEGWGRGSGLPGPSPGAAPSLHRHRLRAHRQVGTVTAPPNRTALVKSMAVGVNPRHSAPLPMSGSEAKVQPSDQ